MPSCCLLPCPSAELPLCFLLLPLLRLPALCVLYDPLHLLRAESPFDPLKVGNCPPQGLVLQLHLLQAFGQVAQRLTKRPYRHCCRQGRFGYDFLLPLYCCRGLLVISYTMRLIPFTSLTMRVDTRSSGS